MADYNEQQDDDDQGMEELVAGEEKGFDEGIGEVIPDGELLDSDEEEVRLRIHHLATFLFKICPIGLQLRLMKVNTMFFLSVNLQIDQAAEADIYSSSEDEGAAGRATSPAVPAPSSSQQFLTTVSLASSQEHRVGSLFKFLFQYSATN